MRERILMATAEEIRVRSIKFTMSDLARRLGVSKRCLYTYFATKEELISSLIDDSLQKLREKRRQIAADDEMSFTEKLKRIFGVMEPTYLPADTRIIDDIKRCMPLEWEKIESFGEEEWEFVVEFLQQGIDSGQLRPVNLLIVKRLMDTAMREMVDYEFLLHNNISLLQAVTELLDILMYGIVVRAPSLEEKEERGEGSCALSD